MGATGQAGGQQGRKPIRATVRPDFKPTPGSVPSISTRLADRKSRSPIQDRMRGVEVALSGGEITLRGTVATDADKRLMERMMLLEPGINSVKNELVVQGVAPEAASTESVEAVRN
jgi:hypothetical protein